jgi:hypothetical protein
MLVRLTSAVVTLLAALLLGTSTSAASPPDRGAVIPLAPYVGQLRTIEVEISGHVGRMIFDTGAGVSSITPEFAVRIGCKPHGAITAFRITGERVTFGRCPAAMARIGRLRTTQEFGVFDLGAVLPKDLPKVDGVIGLDVFRDRTISILPGLAGIRLETQASLARITRALASAPLRLSREAGGAGLTVFAPASSREGDQWLLLDSGNLAGLRLHPLAYAALADPPAAYAEGATPEVVTVCVTGARCTTLRPEVRADLIYDGALSAAFISSQAPTLDLAKGRVWWRPGD